MTDLKNRVVLVTGSARGLGRAIARRCADAGASIALVDILQGEGKSTEDEFKASGVDVLYQTCDVTSNEDIRSTMEAIRARWGRLDGLVNNAALASNLAGKGFEEIDEALWDRVFEINVKGAWKVTRGAAPLLRVGKASRIVNLASDTALWGGDLFLHYVASKGAIISMTRALARELGREGIAVNAVAPGLTDTEATSTVPPHRWERYARGQLIDRRASAEEIASVVAFLLSADAAHMSGQILAVNGGMTLN